MMTLKNSYISSVYKVSSTTVLAWIENALSKKNNLKIQKVGKKYKIVDTPHNHSELSKLSQQALIYRNKSSVKKALPDPELYKYFSQDQLVELINSIKLRKEIPVKLTYVGKKGAEMWNNFTLAASKDHEYQADVKTPELLNKVCFLLKDRISQYKHINIVDLGTGNSKNMLEITKKFLLDEKLRSYIGLDISSFMLSLSEAEVKKLNAKISYKKYIFDFEKRDFANILFENKGNHQTLNLVFIVGNTIGNMENLRRTFENIRYSLDNDDLFIVTEKVENLMNRTQFEHITSTNPHSWLAKDLGIDIEECELVNVFDEKDRQRKSYIKLDKDYVICFKNDNLNSEVVLYKGEDILFWHHKMIDKSDFFEKLDSSGMDLLDFSMTEDLSHMLVITQPKREYMNR